MGAGRRFLAAGLLVLASSVAVPAGNTRSGAVPAFQGGDPGHEDLRAARNGRPAFSPHAATTAPPETSPLLARLLRTKMVFTIATGADNACGPGCKEWIAAEGDMDPEAHIRFRQFIEALANKRLPVFFHSRGGSIAAARGIGNVLREYDMAAAVGRTVLGRRSKRHSLEFKGARCASACAYAFVGATRRSVAAQARLGVHAWQPLTTKRPSREQIDQQNDVLRRYAISNGVDARFIDLSLKTPSKSMHWLSRAELTRLGILGSETFETPWRLLRTSGGYDMVKSVTRDEDAGRQTTIVGIACQFPGTASISVARETGDGQRGNWTVLLKSESGVVWESHRSQLDLEICDQGLGGQFGRPRRSVSSRYWSRPLAADWFSKSGSAKLTAKAGLGRRIFRAINSARWWRICSSVAETCCRNGTSGCQHRVSCRLNRVCKTPQPGGASFVPRQRP
jgi:hypothetical protein